MNWLVRLMLTSFLISSLSNISIAGDWREKYNNSSGQNCCGVKDCRVLNPFELKRDKRGYYFMNGELLININIIHTSEDGQMWGCTTGCLFLPGIS